jgi:hypothetical protein
VLNANPSNIDTVMVGGEFKKRDGELVGVDWEALAQRLRKSSHRIVDGFKTIDKAAIEHAAAKFMLDQ